nr:iron-sulfur cluster assembly 2 [Halichondria panicea]
MVCVVAELLRPPGLVLHVGCRSRPSHRTIQRWYRPSAALQGSQTEPSVASDSSEGLQLSQSCVKQLLAVTEEDPAALLRVVVDGGGCSGFQYKFVLDSQINSDDKVFEREGARVVIDELSLSLLKGATVDYYTELIRSSFRITGNPNAEQGCSCGASFALK